MNAVTVATLERPRFDNGRLAQLGTWLSDNARTLAQYWRDQGIALGSPEDDSQVEFDVWLRVQWDIETALHGPLARGMATLS